MGEGVRVACEWPRSLSWAGPQAPPGTICEAPNGLELEGVPGHPGQHDRGQAPRTIKLAPGNPQAESNGDNRPYGDQREQTGVGEPLTPALAGS